MPQRIVFPKAKVVELEDFDLNEIAPDQIRMRTTASLISAGTESRCLSGNFAPGTHWDNWVKYPFHPGYASVGVIEEIGSEVKNFNIGQNVALRSNHASMHISNESAFTPIPDGLNTESAVWLAMAKIAFIGNLAAQCKTGSRVVILGAGPIGQMSLRWARSSGTEKIVVIDIEASRLEMAAKAGADHCLCCGAGDAVEKVSGIFGGDDKGPDVVIDTTGNPAVFTAALAMAPRFGRVVVIGDVGNPSQQCLSPDLILKGISIVGAHDCHSGGDWPPSRIVGLFFHHCLSGQMDMDGINTHFFAPDQVVQAYKTAGHQHENTMGVIIRWQ